MDGKDHKWVLMTDVKQSNDLHHVLRKEDIRNILSPLRGHQPFFVFLSLAKRGCGKTYLQQTFIYGDVMIISSAITSDAKRNTSTLKYIKRNVKM